MNFIAKNSDYERIITKKDSYYLYEIKCNYNTNNNWSYVITEKEAEELLNDLTFGSLDVISFF